MVFGTIKSLCCLGIIALGLVAAGCDDKAEVKTPSAPASAAKPVPATQPLVPVAAAMDWCKEHGVPESVCAQCNESLVAGFKSKGDWCKEHSKPESQCFECHPELKDKFAAAFKTKYGKEPPAVEAKKK